METRICKKCQKEKMIKDMHSTKNRKGDRQYWFTCRNCYNEHCRAYQKTPAGLVSRIYAAQKKASKKRNMAAPFYSYQELLKWVQAQPNFKTLYDAWTRSDYKSRLRPSIDRLDDYMPYSFENIRLVTWDENMFKNHEVCRVGTNKMADVMCKPVVQIAISGEYMNTFLSVKIASDATGVNQCSIARVMRGTLKMAGNFIWVDRDKYYKNPSFYTKKHDIHKKEIVQMDMNMNFICEYSSIREACREVDTLHGNINRVLQKKGKSAAGYFWMYAKDYYESIC